MCALHLGLHRRKYTNETVNKSTELKITIISLLEVLGPHITHTNRKSDWRHTESAKITFLDIPRPSK